MRKFLLSLVALSCIVPGVRAEYETADQASRDRINQILNELKPANLTIGKIAADTILIDYKKGKIKMDMNKIYGYVPEIESYTEAVKEQVNVTLGKEYSIEVTVSRSSGRRIFAKCPA